MYYSENYPTDAAELEISVIEDIIKRWKKDLGKRFNYDLPVDYLCVDLETTGFDRKDDLIVEIGHCQVVDRSSEYYMSQVLDWTQSEHVDIAWLEHKLDACKASMAKTGRDYHMTIDRMRSEGEKPEEVLKNYVDLLEATRKLGNVFVGHNFARFDAPFFTFAVGEWLAEEFVFNDGDILDTAVIEKAAQASLPQQPDESMDEYFKRVMRTPCAGVKYNLDQHCVEKYGLLEKYHLDMSEAHTAGFDAMLCHLLLEEFRLFAD
jgi:DNA polymerase III epsilon subunit-like protein